MQKFIVSGLVYSWAGLSVYSGKISLNMITDSGFDIRAIQRWTCLEGVEFDHFLRSLHEDTFYHYICALKMSLRYVKFSI